MSFPCNNKIKKCQSESQGGQKESEMTTHVEVEGLFHEVRGEAHVQKALLHVVGNSVCLLRGGRLLSVRLVFSFGLAWPAGLGLGLQVAVHHFGQHRGALFRAQNEGVLRWNTKVRSKRKRAIQSICHYLQQGLGVCPLLHILVHRLRNEVVEFLGPLGLFRESWGLACGNNEKGVHRVEVVVGRSTLGHLNGGDSNGPNVSLLVIAARVSRGDDLWRHPVRASNDRLPPLQGLCQLRRHSKIG